MMVVVVGGMLGWLRLPLGPWLGSSAGLIQLGAVVYGGLWLAVQAYRDGRVRFFRSAPGSWTQRATSALLGLGSGVMGGLSGLVLGLWPLLDQEAGERAGMAGPVAGGLLMLALLLISPLSLRTEPRGAGTHAG